MKTLRKSLLGVAALAVGAALVAFGQVVQPLPLPAFWVASSGNYFGLNTNAVPVVRIGTNTWTGLTTNSIGTNVLVIKNGIVVGVNP
jgi:hypothetical protein